MISHIFVNLFLQYDKLGTIRAHFFRVIRQHNFYEDLPLRLEVFITLTENGKDLTYIEEETGNSLFFYLLVFGEDGNLIQTFSV
jgi:tuberous sclerosis protein 2